MVRATAANAQIRAFACTTREPVETARAAHNTRPVVPAALGRLLSAGVMMGSMLKGDDELITCLLYTSSHKQEEATGTEEISVRPNRGYMRSLLLHSHDNDRDI